MEGMIGEIRMFAGNFAPRSWAFCEGQLLPISQNSALFSILGTIYGGDGRTTFALPDMRGRAPVGGGNGPGLSDARLGAKGGVDYVTLNTTQIPSHSHGIKTQKQKATNNPLSTNIPNNVILTSNAPLNAFNSHAATESMKDGTLHLTVNNTGGTQSHENRSPFLAMYYIMALQGVFPSRS